MHPENIPSTRPLPNRSRDRQGATTTAHNTWTLRHSNLYKTYETHNPSPVVSIS